MSLNYYIPFAEDVEYCRDFFPKSSLFELVYSLLNLRKSFLICLLTNLYNSVYSIFILADSLLSLKFLLSSKKGRVFSDSLPFFPIFCFWFHGCSLQYNIFECAVITFVICCVLTSLIRSHLSFKIFLARTKIWSDISTQFKTSKFLIYLWPVCADEIDFVLYLFIRAYPCPSTVFLLAKLSVGNRQLVCIYDFQHSLASAVFSNCPESADTFKSGKMLAFCTYLAIEISRQYVITCNIFSSPVRSLPRFRIHFRHLWRHSLR